MSINFVLYAPNVHTGGGLVLLKALLHDWPDGKPLRAFLDVRNRGRLGLSASVDVAWVAPSLSGRLCAELRLRRAVDETVTVLCFHGLPPLLPLPGRVVMLIQNRLLIERGNLAEYPLKVRIRLRIERLWSKSLQMRCSRYIVQTPSMAASLKQWLRHEVPISVVPFMPAKALAVTSVADCGRRQFDFIYVASGEAHKNHHNLLLAWRLLGDVGLKPSLALTVDPTASPTLVDEILRTANNFSLNVVNLGQLPAADLAQVYQSSSALIYPSLTESLGMPLLEATSYGLPIVASELDYVRDIVEPVETFDPESPVSITRAVRRFLNASEPLTQPRTPEEFLSEVLR